MSCEARPIEECATLERVNFILRYDPETGDLFPKVPRRGVTMGKPMGHIDKTTGYVRISIDGKCYYVQRVAHLIMTGHWPESNPDHENRIRHDNRWSNIKDLATDREQQGNQSIRSDNVSGLRGVCWQALRGKWEVYIKVRDGKVHIGNFGEGDLRLAGLYYDAAAKLAWGLRFSNLNFPPEESDQIVLPERVLKRIGNV